MVIRERSENEFGRRQKRSAPSLPLEKILDPPLFVQTRKFVPSNDDSLQLASVCSILGIREALCATSIKIDSVWCWV